jgi:hypothetical protein
LPKEVWEGRMEEMRALFGRALKEVLATDMEHVDL